MDNCQQFFISILSDHLAGNKTNPPKNIDIDWKEIQRLSKSHQVDGIVYYQCKTFMPKDALQYYEQAFSATLYFFRNRRAAMKIVTDAFRKNMISFFAVKGFAVSRFYPIPELRTMGDCDIIVSREDMPTAMNIMRGLGYQGIDNEKADSWVCSKNGYLFELHDKLVQDNEHSTEQQKSFFNKYSPYIDQGIIDPNFSFLFLLMHLRKHFE